MSNTVYLNGQWLPREEAKISPEDRGFMFADGIYEVVRYYFGKPLAMQLHLNRMNAGLNEIRIEPPRDLNIAAVADELVRRNKTPEAAVYWQITRGVAPRNFNFPPKGTPPTVFAVAYPTVELKADAPTQEFKAITQPDIRWKRCVVKAISLLPNVLASQKAAEAGCECAILVRDNIVTEATSRSIFIVEQGALVTYPLDGRILDSITRRIAIELAHKHRIPVREELYPLERLYSADEVLAVGSTSEIAAVTSVDGRPIATQKAGPITTQLFELYKRYVFEHCRE